METITLRIAWAGRIARVKPSVAVGANGSKRNQKLSQSEVFHVVSGWGFDKLHIIPESWKPVWFWSLTGSWFVDYLLQRKYWIEFNWLFSQKQAIVLSNVKLDPDNLIYKLQIYSWKISEIVRVQDKMPKKLYQARELQTLLFDKKHTTKNIYLTGRELKKTINAEDVELCGAVGIRAQLKELLSE